MCTYHYNPSPQPPLLQHKMKVSLVFFGCQTEVIFILSQSQFLSFFFLFSFLTFACCHFI